MPDDIDLLIDATIGAPADDIDSLIDSVGVGPSLPTGRTLGGDEFVQIPASPTGARLPSGNRVDFNPPAQPGMAAAVAQAEPAARYAPPTVTLKEAAKTGGKSEQLEYEARQMQESMPPADRSIVGEVGAGLIRGTMEMGQSAAGLAGTVGGALEGAVGPNLLSAGLDRKRREIVAGLELAKTPYKPSEETNAYSGRAIAGTIAGAAPNMAAQVGLAAIPGGTAARVGAFALGAAGPVIGDVYNDARASGQSAPAASVEALTAGYATAITSTVPGFAIFAKSPTGKAALAYAIKSSRIPAAMLAEGSQETVESVLHEAVKSAMRHDPDTFSPEYFKGLGMEFIVGAIMGGGAKAAVDAGSLVGSTPEQATPPTATEPQVSDPAVISGGPIPEQTGEIPNVIPTDAAINPNFAPGLDQVIPQSPAAEPSQAAADQPAAPVPQQEGELEQDLQKPSAEPHGGEDTEVVPGEATTVPEKPETLSLQLADLSAGKRAAVLVTPGEKMPSAENAPARFKRINTPAGRFIFDPEKTTAEDIRKAVAEDRIGEVLGYGVVNKPAEENVAGVVTVRTADGTERQAVVVDQAGIPAAIEAAKRVASPGDTIGMETPMEVLDARTRNPAEVRGVADGDGGRGPDVPAGVRATVAEDVRPVVDRVPPVVGNQGAKAGDQPGDVGGVKRPTADIVREMAGDSLKEFDNDESVVAMIAERIDRATKTNSNRKTAIKQVARELERQTGKIEDSPDIARRFNAIGKAMRQYKPAPAPVESAATPTQETPDGKEGQGRKEGLLSPDTATTPAPAARATGAGLPDQPDAKPTEPDKEPVVTSARKEMMEEDRKAIGLDALDSPARRSWQSAMDAAEKDGIPDRALRIAAEVNQTPRALSDIETAGLVKRAAGLKNEHAAAMEKVKAATDPADVKFAAAEASRIEAEFDALSTALRKSGTEKGRALAAQKLTLDQDLSLVAIKARAKAAKGEALSEAEAARFAELSAKLEETTRRIGELEVQVADAIASKAVRQHKAGRARPESARRAEFDATLAKAKELLKLGCR